MSHLNVRCYFKIIQCTEEKSCCPLPATYVSVYGDPVTNVLSYVRERTEPPTTTVKHSTLMLFSVSGAVVSLPADCGHVGQSEESPKVLLSSGV